MLNKIDFSPGKITYDDFDIKPLMSFEEQEFSFKEDLFQVSYEGKYTIDIGWYPDCEKNGKFKIRIIKDYNWMDPIYCKKTKDFKKLFKFVEECAQIVRNLLQKEK